MDRSPQAILDELLILRCQQGEASALNELIRIWQPRLMRHAARLTQSPEAARDVCQNSWLSIVDGLTRLQDPAAFPKWAYQIVSRKSVDWIRQQQRQRTLIQTQATNTPTATDRDDDSSQSDEIRCALKQLPAEQQQVLSMFYLDEMSVAEIAGALSIPSGTVKSRLHTARRQLKIIIERENYE